VPLRPDEPTRRFKITMGQAFFEKLPTELRKLGAKVWGVDRGPVEVTVMATFPTPRAELDVQKDLWQVWPECSVRVEGRH
jgi:hypothetical protein